MHDPAPSTPSGSAPYAPYAPHAPHAPHAAADAAGVRAATRAARGTRYADTDPRLAPLRADLATRVGAALEAAGVTYPGPEFDALVLDMARVALHWSVAEVHRRALTPPLGGPAVPTPSC